MHNVMSTTASDPFADPDVIGGVNPLRAGWDNCTVESQDLTTQTAPPRAGIPLRLADGVRLRREDFGAIVQVGTFTRLLNHRAAELLEGIKDRPRLVIDDRDEQFLAACLAHGVLTEGSAGSRARIYGQRSGAAYQRMHSPASVEIEITNKCFRHCSYCAYESGPSPRIGQEHELSTEQWMEVLSELERDGVMALEFTGGDPFVRHDAIELLQYASKLGLLLWINSDLSILNERHIEGLAALDNLVAVQTSLDGATTASCDLTGGRGGFKTLLRQLDILHGAGLPISVGATIHRHNAGEVSAIADLAAEKGAGRLYIGPMYAAGRATALNDLVVTDELWHSAVAQYAHAIRSGVIAFGGRPLARPCRRLPGGGQPGRRATAPHEPRHPRGAHRSAGQRLRVRQAPPVAPPVRDDRQRPSVRDGHDLARVEAPGGTPLLRSGTQRVRRSERSRHRCRRSGGTGSQQRAGPRCPRTQQRLTPVVGPRGRAGPPLDRSWPMG